MTQEEALQKLVNGINLAIQRGAFNRNEVVDLNKAIEIFMTPPPQNENNENNHAKEVQE